MREIDTITAFEQWLDGNIRWEGAAVQDLNLLSFTPRILQKPQFTGTLFLGCEMAPEAAGHVVTTGGIVIPDVEAFSFPVHRSRLYDVETLFRGFDLSDPDGFKRTWDYAIYKEFLDNGGPRPDSILVSLTRRLHDHSITDALDEILQGRKVVAVMGGHGMERRDPFYLRIAGIARTLTQDGYLMVSGGGPGAMEATHLGAWFATRPESDLRDAVKRFGVRPSGAQPGKEYADPDWLHRAWRVREQYPVPAGDRDRVMSVGIPTWLYGHEPPAPFATHIAKYFANSVREDGLLAIATHGVIFGPGNAGTTQEIFQDATQNHYGTTGYCSPMILFGRKWWTETRPVWPLLEHVSKLEKYGKLVTLTDDTEKIIWLIRAFDPDDYGIIRIPD